MLCAAVYWILPVVAASCGYLGKFWWLGAGLFRLCF